MRRDLITITTVMLLSSGVAAAVNAVGHRMDWIRRPLARPPANGTTQSSPSEVPQTTQTASAEADEATTQAAANLVQGETVLEHLNRGTALFVDARAPEEYAAGHLRGAVNLPSSEIFANIDRVTSLASPDQLIIVYCGGGGCDAGHNVADALRRDFGYTNVMIHAKGWEEVKASEQLRHCVVTGEQP
jgi:rhodanese-related sulfurtransferase